MAQAGKPQAIDRDRFEPADERGPIKPFDFDPNRYVFLSYVRETNPDLLRAVVRSLLRRGVSVWIYDPTPCRLTAEEDRAVQSQEEEQDERPGTPWQTLVADAIDKASCVLMLIGKRSHENQMFEIEHTIQKARYSAVRVDDVPDADIPEKLREGVIRRLDATSQPPEVIAAAIQRLADRLAKDVLGDDFRPVTRSIKLSGIVSDGRLGLIAAAAIVLLGGAAAAILLRPEPSPPPAPRIVVDETAIPVTGPRLALVITQTEYNGTSIRRVAKAEEEGRLIREALGKLDFDITPVANKSKAALETALDQFREKLKAAGPAAVAFIYYTGHGIQHPQLPDNFLLGTNAELMAAADIETYGVSLTAQRDLFRDVGARGVFMIFDACRNIPPELKAVGAPEGYKPPTKGLARIKAPVGMLVAYATEEGDFAQEGIYAPILAEELVRPNQIIEAAFVRTKNRVADMSAREQLPWNDSKIYESLCLSCTPKE